MMKQMLNLKIAIVDDNENDSSLLREAIAKFNEAHKGLVNIAVECFSRGILFVEPFPRRYIPPGAHTDHAGVQLFAGRQREMMIEPGSDLEKVIAKVQNETGEDKIVIRVKNGYRTVKVNSIKYIEVNTHDVFYYTSNETYRTREVLKDIEKNLNNPSFVKCSSSYLINLDYVDAIDKDDVRIDGKRIKIARTRKKEFLKAFLNKYK